MAGNRREKRSLGFPAEMTSGRRWVRADGKRPIRVDGSSAKSNDPSTWASFDEVRQSNAGDGFGVMLGGGLGCYDFDRVSDAEARELVALIPERVLFVERSVSGRGVHAFVEAVEGAGSKKWQGRYERYTRERFILVTGNRISL
ncbi:MAG: DNA primase [Candidatus Leucobacter sulfamidivorax]|nr:DNA primase [Candidatus Leucobacter sulfamidivorax]